VRCAAPSRSRSSFVADLRAAHRELLGKEAATEADAESALCVEPDRCPSPEIRFAPSDANDLTLSAIVRRPSGDLLILPEVAARPSNGFKCPRSYPKLTTAIENGFLRITSVEDLCETQAGEGELVDWTATIEGTRTVESVWDLASGRHVATVTQGKKPVTIEVRDGFVILSVAEDACEQTIARPALYTRRAAP
jgi:hypothetical protein